MMVNPGVKKFEEAALSAFARFYEVRFRSEKVEVAALYEIGSRPWIELSRLVSIDGRIEKVDSFDLELLLQERAPDEEYEGDFDIDGGMQYGVSRLARLLELYGQDVLQGDFGKVERIRKPR